MKIWLVYAALCTTMWGIWGLFGKLATRTVTSKNLILLGTVGALVIYPIYFLLFFRNFKFEWKVPSYYFALLAGLVGSLGAIFFYLSLSKGEASKVVVVTALYPALTVLLSFLLLKEQLSPYKMAGIAFAIIGIILLSKA
jgi:transporter family protein